MKYLKIGLYSYVMYEKENLKDLAIGIMFLAYLVVLILSVAVFATNFSMLYRYIYYRDTISRPFVFELELILLMIICIRLVFYIRDTEDTSDIIVKSLTIMVSNTDQYGVDYIDVLYIKESMKERKWDKKVDLIYSLISTFSIIAEFFYIARIISSRNDELLIPLEIMMFIIIWISDKTATKTLINDIVGN